MGWSARWLAATNRMQVGLDLGRRQVVGSDQGPALQSKFARATHHGRPHPLWHHAEADDDEITLHTVEHGDARQVGPAFETM